MRRRGCGGGDAEEGTTRRLSTTASTIDCVLCGQEAGSSEGGECAPRMQLTRYAILPRDVLVHTGAAAGGGQVECANMREVGAGTLQLSLRVTRVGATRMAPLIER